MHCDSTGKASGKGNGHENKDKLAMFARLVMLVSKWDVGVKNLEDFKILNIHQNNEASKSLYRVLH